MMTGDRYVNRIPFFSTAFISFPVTSSERKRKGRDRTPLYRCLTPYPLVHSPLHLFISSSIRPSIPASIRPSVHLSFSFYIHPSVRRAIQRPSDCRSRIMCMRRFITLAAIVFLVSWSRRALKNIAWSETTNIG